MKKLFLFSLLCFLILGSQNLQSQGIEFEHGTWKEALSKAKKEKKLIFMDCYTDWCGPCKWMAKTVFSEEKVGAFFNKNFINVKMDMEKGEGVALAKQYNVSAYPTLAFINAEGVLVHRAVGALKVEEFLKLGEKVAGGLNSEQEMNEKYASGDYDRDFLYEYLMYMSENGMNPSAVLDEYVKDLKPEMLLNENEFSVFMKFFQRTDTEYCKYFEANLSRFQEKFDGEEVIRKYASFSLSRMFDALKEKDMDAFEASEMKIKDIKDSYVQSSLDRLRLNRVLVMDSEEAMYETFHKWVRDGKEFSSEDLNNKAWQVYESTELSPEFTDMAIFWAEKSIELDQNYYNMDTYAMLLWKAGSLNKAVASMKEAIDMGNEAGEDVTDSEKELAKMQAEN